MESPVSDSKPVILIVDDQPENIRILSGFLKGKYTPVAATNGSKALEISFSKNQPDIILLDIMMPGMDGYEVCRHLKNDDRTCNIPVIFLTARDGIKDEVRGFETGAVDFLTKPFNPERLEARLRAHLKIRQNYEKNINLDKPDQQSKIDHILESYETYLKKMQDQIDSAMNIYHNIIDLKQDNKFPLDLSWRQQSVAELGGDFIDIKENGSALSILVADVAGHDIGSSYHTILLKAFFDENCYKEDNGITLFKLLNRHLLKSGKEKQMITGLFARISLDEKSCEMVSAGHPWAVIHRKNGSFPEQIFTSGGTPLGLQSDTSFISERIDLSAGDRLFVYTDGVSNASRFDTKTGKRKKLYAKGLNELFFKYHNLPLDETISMIWHDLLKFCKGKPKDDILLFGFEVPQKIQQESGQV